MKHLSPFSSLAGLALVLLATSAGGHAAEVRKVTHAQGVAEISGTPKKVAALGLASLDTLDALGIDVAAIPAAPEANAAARWPDRLLRKYGQSDGKYLQIAGARNVPAGQVNPQVEQIKAFKPDLIVLDGRSRNLLGELESIAPTLDLSVSDSSFVGSVVQNVLTLGAAFGREAQANAQAGELLAQVRALHESASKQGTALVLFAVGERVMPQQPDARFGMIYEVAGMRPVLRPGEGEGLSSGRPAAQAQNPDAANDPSAKAAVEVAQKARLDAEAKYLAEVMAREPDWLFVVDRNAAFGEAKAAQVMAATPTIANSRAWKQEKVVFLDQDGNNWYLMAGGLGLLKHSLGQIQAAFAAQAGK